MYNYNNTNKNTKQDIIKWIIAFSLIIILLASSIVALSIGLTKDTKQINTLTNENAPMENDFATAINDSEFVKLSMSSAPMQTSNNSVSKTLTATVLPVTATNKLVDWSVAWVDENNTNNVSQFITVTPTSNGSNTATVTCLKAFTGNIVVTVTTRESGYSASCIISFVGIPTEFTVSSTANSSGGFYYLGVGSNYVFDVKLTNPFNSVGSNYNNISCHLIGVGSMVLGYMERYSASGNSQWYDASNKTVTLDSLKDKFMTINYSEGKLNITTIRSIESYYASLKRMDGGRTTAYTDKFRSYVDDCYFKILVKENTSGLSKEILIRFDNSIVTGVSVNNGEMQF